MDSKIIWRDCFLQCFLALLIASPMFCQRFKEQVDPNIPQIVGLDVYVETTTKTAEEQPLTTTTVLPKIKSSRVLAAPKLPFLRVTIDDDVSGSPPPEDYIVSTTLETVPMVYFGGKLGKDDDCTAYGQAINDVQMGVANVEEKKKKLSGEDTILQFGSKICNWARFRLECIPNEHRDPAGATTAPGGKKTLLKGTCQCMRGLGEKAIWIEADDPKQSKCYIPADLGSHSDCGYDINLPYGEIDEVVKSKKFAASAGSMCVKNSVCTTGYEYIGLRCHCKKGTKHDRKKGTCNKGQRFTTPGPILFFIIAILQYFP